jgi:hypothetical protein
MVKGSHEKGEQEAQKAIGDFQLNFQQDFSTSILRKVCQNQPKFKKYEFMTDSKI